MFKEIKNVINIKQYDKESLAVFAKPFYNYKYIMETQHAKRKSSNYIKTLPEYDESKIENSKLNSEENSYTSK